MYIKELIAIKPDLADEQWGQAHLKWRWSFLRKPVSPFAIMTPPDQNGLHWIKPLCLLHLKVSHTADNLIGGYMFLGFPAWTVQVCLQSRAHKPAIGKVHSHITAQRPLRSDRKHVADDEHPDHQHWIDRWPTEPRIIRCQLGMHPTQIKNRSDLADRMIVRYRLIETK